jgi:sulfotransferase family protein
LAERDGRSRRPVLVTGAHRSGTTWVGRMIDLSPEVGYINEPFNPHHQPGICACRFPLWFQYVNRDNEYSFRPHLSATLAFRYRPVAQLARTRRPADAERLLRDGLEFTRARLRGARPLMKDPIAAFSSSWLARTFDMATIVLVRHPAGFASSLKRLGWSHPFSHFLAQPALMEERLGRFEAEVRRMAKVEHDIVDQASLLWRMIYSVLLEYRHVHPDWIVVRQEDLARDAVHGFARIFEQLGLPYTEHIRERVRWYSSGSTELEANAGPYAIRRASEQIIHGWRRRLSAEEQSRLRARVESLAAEFYSESEW